MSDQPSSLTALASEFVVRILRLAACVMYALPTFEGKCILILLCSILILKHHKECLTCVGCNLLHHFVLHLIHQGAIVSEDLFSTLMLKNTSFLDFSTLDLFFFCKLKQLTTPILLGGINGVKLIMPL
jgi:hypothetical protein